MVQFLHGKQAVEPVVSAYVPWGHGVHPETLMAVISEYVPIGHNPHELPVGMLHLV